MSDQAAAIQAKLQAGGLESLVRLAMDYLLGRPVASLIDPDWAAGQVVATLKATADAGRTEGWLRDLVKDLQTKVPPGKLGDHAPKEVVDPLREVLTRPFAPDRELMRRLLDHPAMERMFKDVLVSAIRNFGTRFAAVGLGGGPAPEPLTRGLERLKSLQRRASGGVLGELSQGIERQAEQRIRDHVDQAIHAVLSQVADHLCADDHAALYGSFRAHLLDTALKTDNQVLSGELAKLNPDDLVRTAAASIAALARRPGLREELAGAIRSVLTGAGDRTAQDFLDASGLDQGWRAELEAQVVAQSKSFVETKEFGSWLSDLLAGTASSTPATPPTPEGAPAPRPAGPTRSGRKRA